MFSLVGHFLGNAIAVTKERNERTRTLAFALTADGKAAFGSRCLAHAVCAATTCGCYEALRIRKSRVGRAFSVDSHRNILAEAKSFLRWCTVKELAEGKSPDNHGLGPGLVPAPGRTVAVVELLRSTVLVHVVTEGEHRAGDSVQDVRDRLIPVVAACGNVARTHQNRVAGARRLRRRRGALAEPLEAPSVVLWAVAAGRA